MSILHSPIEVREEYHRNRINGVQRIIEKLEAMKKETMDYRLMTYSVQIEYNNEVDYQIDYFKRQLELSNLDNTAAELTRIIRMQHEIIQKHYEYLARINEERQVKKRKFMDDEISKKLDLVSGMVSDTVMN